MIILQLYSKYLPVLEGPRLGFTTDSPRLGALGLFGLDNIRSNSQGTVGSKAGSRAFYFERHCTPNYQETFLKE